MGGIFPSFFVVDEGDNFNQKMPCLKCGAFDRDDSLKFIGARGDILGGIKVAF